MAFAGEFGADALAGTVDRGALDHGIGAGEVDVFEHAEAAFLAAERLDGVHAAIVDHHDLAGFDVTHEFGAADVERAGFAGEHPAGGAVGVGQAAEDQRADAERVSHAEQGLFGEGDQRVGADDLLQRVDEAIDHGGIQADGDEVDEHLAVHRRLEQAAAPHQRPAQGGGVGEVAVVPDSEAAEFEIGEQRLHVAQHRLTGGGVAVVADGARAWQLGHDPGVREVLADQAEAAMGVEAATVVGDDTRRFLAAVLQSVQAEGGDGGGVGTVPDAEYATFFMRLVVVDFDFLHQETP